MAVLIIICTLISLVVIYKCLLHINKFTKEKFRYEFFTNDALGLYILIDLGLYFGHDWYTSALIKNGDILNGILIMFFACCLLIFILIKNIKKTNYLYGILLTLLQFVIYLPFSFIGAFALVLLIGFFAQTKPVYRIN